MKHGRYWRYWSSLCKSKRCQVVLGSKVSCCKDSGLRFRVADWVGSPVVDSSFCCVHTTWHAIAEENVG